MLGCKWHYALSIASRPEAGARAQVEAEFRVATPDFFTILETDGGGVILVARSSCSTRANYVTF